MGEDGGDTAGDTPQSPDQPNGGGLDDNSGPNPVSLPKTMFTEAGLRDANPLLQAWTPSDKTLRLVLGDTLHQNDETQLTKKIK